MNLKQKKLQFTEIEQTVNVKIKDDKSLQTKNKVELIDYDIKWIPPSCFKSSFEDEKWVSLSFNKSRPIDELLNFSMIPQRWINYTKKVLCIIDQFQEHGSTRISAFGSFLAYFGIFNHFFNKVEQLNIKSLKDISEEDFRNIYLEYSNGKTKPTNTRYLSGIKKLYEYGHLHHNFLEDGLSFNPGNDFFLIGRAKTSKEVGETAIIEEEDAILLISTAIDWIVNKKEDFIGLIELSKIHKDKKLSKNVKNSKKSLTFVQARKALHANPNLHKRLIEIRQNFNKDLVSFLEQGHQNSKNGLEPELIDFMKINLIIKKLHSFYQAFTYVVCASFTGWRASEVFSISIDNVKETPSGFYLDSNLIKTTQNKNELISRPIPEIVAKAIVNLQEINSKMEGVFSHKLVKEDKANSLFKNPFGKSLNVKVLNEDLNMAWKNISNKNFNFSTHQFRRFFAHFYIRRYQGNADAVRWNFRHISKNMILHYTQQAMNAKQLSQSKKELAKEIANNIVQENEYTSIGVGKDLKDMKLDLSAKVLTVEEASKYITDKIDSEFKNIHPMEWGYCMFQNGYKGAICEAKTGPIEARSEPSTCGRCKFLCTGTEHVEFWQQTILLHQDIKNDKFATKIMKNESDKIIAIGSNILNRHSKKE